MLPKLDTLRISNLPANLECFMDTQEIAPIVDFLGGRKVLPENYTTFFVTVNDGEIEEVWACTGTPYIYKDADLLYRGNP